MLLVEAVVGTPHTFQNFYSWKNWPKECKVHAAYIPLLWTPIFLIAAEFAHNVQIYAEHKIGKLNSAHLLLK